MLAGAALSESNTQGKPNLSQQFLDPAERPPLWALLPVMWDDSGLTLLLTQKVRADNSKSELSVIQPMENTKVKLLTDSTFSLAFGISNANLRWVGTEEGIS